MDMTGKIAVVGLPEGGWPKGWGDRRLPDVDIWPGNVVAYPFGREGSFLVEVGSTLAATVPMMAAMFSVSERRMCQVLGRVAHRRAARGEASDIRREFMEQTLHRRDGVETSRDTAFHTAAAILDVAECLGDAWRWIAFAREWAGVHHDGSACWKLLDRCEVVILDKRLDLADEELGHKTEELSSTMKALRAGPKMQDRERLLDRLRTMVGDLESWLAHLETCGAEVRH